jgi:hypothetical protein
MNTRTIGNTRIQIRVVVECRRCGHRHEVDERARDYGGVVWACSRSIVPECECPSSRMRTVTGFAVLEDLDA